MTRHSYDYYRSGRSQAVAISQPPRDLSHGYQVLGDRTRYRSPSRELESDRNTGRRRISLACLRCRKRKIKCSGETGEIPGCLACRNAGVEAGGCQYLRVSSVLTVECATPVQLEWPYQGNGLPTGPPFQMSSGLGQYLSTNHSVPSLPSGSFPGVPRLPRYSLSNNCLGTSYASMPAAQEYYANMNLNMVGSCDGLLDPYNGTQTVQYAIPYNDPQVSNAMYGPQESSRHWMSPTNSSRYASNYDVELSSKFSTSAASYANAAMPPASDATDTNSIFPAMGSLVQSLPMPQLSNDRILPTLRHHGFVSTETGITANNGSYGEVPSFFSSQNSGVKSSIWDREDSTNLGTHGPANIASISSANLSSDIDRKASESPPPNEASSFLPGKNITPPSSSGNTPTGELFPSQSASSVNDLESQLLEKPPYTPTIFQRFSRSQLPSSVGYAKITNTTKTESHFSSSDIPRFGGQPYLPMGQQQPQQLSQVTSAIRRDSIENSMLSTPRTSIASSSTSRR